MEKNFIYDEYNIRDGFKRTGKDCIYDPIREILVIQTPEEIVRQKFIQYLLKNLKVPKNMIEVEVPMSYYDKVMRGRADIIINFIEDGVMMPLAVIECKAPYIPLSQEVWDQVFGYDDTLGAPFVVTTNGETTEWVAWYVDEEEYLTLEEVPLYETMCNLIDVGTIEEDEIWIRPEFSRKPKQKIIDEFLDYGWIGVDSANEIIPFVINLGSFIQDDSLEIEPTILGDTRVIESGSRYYNFGNAAGGSWAGDYRYFLLEDKNRNNQIISISIMGKMKCEDDPRWGNSRGTTTLIVAVDNFDKRHNSLQLNIDKYLEIGSEEYTIWHDGTLTRGKSGAMKRSVVLDFIREKAPELINGDRITLGRFSKSVEINWEQKNTRSFFSNLIKYALIRDDIRRIHSAKV